MLGVVPGNNIPLHVQIGHVLEQRVRTGTYSPGQSLPSYRDLGREFGVSIGVIQRVIQEASEKGIVVVHGGRGVRIAPANRSKRAALAFGLIQPYRPGLAFDFSMLMHAERVFSAEDNFLVVRSSEGVAAREREIAEQLVHNGVQGLLVWPVENNPNGAFFQDLAGRVPIIFADRLLDNEMPAVIHDTYRWGHDLCEHLLERLRSRRLLVLMDNLTISSYHELVRGLQDSVRDLGRVADLTIAQLPISEFIQQIKQADFSNTDRYVAFVRRLLTSDGYDALFCLQDEFLDCIVVDSGLVDQFPKVRLSSSCNPHVNNRMRRYVESGVIQWAVDHPRLITVAATRLQQAVLRRRPMTGVTELAVKLFDPNEPTAVDGHVDSIYNSSNTSASGLARKVPL